MEVIAIVGKPNVGKSTLFNRIIQKNKSIVDDKAGITRDRIYGIGEWLTKKFHIIDTGGFSTKQASFQENINNQVEIAIDEANTIIFVTSLKNGIDNDDIYIAKLLKKKAKNKDIILVCNKAESNANQDLSQFYNLGFGKPILVSSAHGIGVGDLLDIATKKIINTHYNDNNKLTFCIIGRPNVGKSSLTNAILREKRVIVSDIPGTTRDSIDVDFKYNNKQYTIIDTAGIRRKGKIQGIEKYSVLRSEKSIERSKIIILLLDGSTDFTEQDEVIGGLASSANIPTIIAINKIDLIQKSDKEFNTIKRKIRDKFKHLSWAPIIFISALDNKKINTIFETIDKLEEESNIKVSTSLLNDTIAKAQMLQQPPLFKGKRININYATQVNSQIPTFVIFCTNVESLHFSYARYIENKIREAFGINNVPITLFWKDKNARKRSQDE